MILELDAITHYFGADLILDAISLQVGERDRIGVVGYNGCGKTTLLNIITGEMEPTSGSVGRKDGATAGYLKQAVGMHPDYTVYREMKTANGADRLLRRMKALERSMGSDPSLLSEYASVSAGYEAAGGYDLDFQIKKVLQGMSFSEEDFLKKVSVLSGGERTRLAFSKLLLSHPDILVLDEPTNHLDAGTLEWLEEFLLSYSGAVITVSHDRWFLDRVVTRIFEISNHKGRLYRGNYSAFLQQRAFRIAEAEKEYKQQSEQAMRLREYAERNIVRASTSKMAKSRLKMLGRMQLDRPENVEHERLRFSILPDSEPYRDVLTAVGLTVRAGPKTLIGYLDLSLKRGERIAVVGPNGSGKSTLLDVLAGKRKPESGKIKVGGGVKMAFLPQNLYADRTKTPLQYIWDRYPAMTQLQVRNLLASLGFQGDEVFLGGAGLSGGELARLHFARISLEHPNLLILDEPTNHLDIYSKELLTDALAEYPGTMMVVSHDRYLLSRLGAKILLIEGGTAVFFDSFADCRDRASKQKSLPAPTPEEIGLEQSDFPEAPSQKEQRRLKAQQRERAAFLEQNIERMEKRLKTLETESLLPEVASDHIRLSALFDETEQLRLTLAEYSDEWLRLT